MTFLEVSPLGIRTCRSTEPKTAEKGSKSSLTWVAESDGGQGHSYFHPQVLRPIYSTQQSWVKTYWVNISYPEGYHPSPKGIIYKLTFQLLPSRNQCPNHIRPSISCWHGMKRGQWIPWTHDYHHGSFGIGWVPWFKAMLCSVLVSFLGNL